MKTILAAGFWGFVAMLVVQVVADEPQLDSQAPMESMLPPSDAPSESQAIQDITEEQPSDRNAPAVEAMIQPAAPFTEEAVNAILNLYYTSVDQKSKTLFEDFFTPNASVDIFVKNAERSAEFSSSSNGSVSNTFDAFHEYVGAPVTPTKHGILVYEHPLAYVKGTPNYSKFSNGCFTQTFVFLFGKVAHTTIHLSDKATGLVIPENIRSGVDMFLTSLNNRNKDTLSMMGESCKALAIARSGDTARILWPQAVGATSVNELITQYWADQADEPVAQLDYTNILYHDREVLLQGALNTPGVPQASRNFFGVIKFDDDAADSKIDHLIVKLETARKTN